MKEVPLIEVDVGDLSSIKKMCNSVSVLICSFNPSPKFYRQLAVIVAKTPVVVVENTMPINVMREVFVQSRDWSAKEGCLISGNSTLALCSEVGVYLNEKVPCVTGVKIEHLTSMEAGKLSTRSNICEGRP